MVLCLLGLKLFAQINLKHPEKTFDLLTGSWQYRNNPEFETWKKVGDAYTGEIYSVMNSDTIISQHLTILKENKTFVLVQQIILQPNLPQIRYQLTEVTSGRFVFTTRNESFPQNIIYEFKGDSLEIIQGGKINGKEQSISFIYSKYNK